MIRNLFQFLDHLGRRPITPFNPLIVTSVLVEVIIS